MKNLILSALCMLSINLFSQNEKGNWLIGGLASYDYTKNTSGSGNINLWTTKVSALSLSPDAGYFLINNLCLGLRTEMDFGSVKSEDYDTKNTYNKFNFLPFLRVYFLHKTNFSCLADLSAGYGFEFDHHQMYDGNEVESYPSTSNQTTGTLSAGVCYFVRKNIAVEGLFIYQIIDGHSIYDFPSEPEYKSSYRYYDIGYRIGLQFFLEKKTKE